MVKTIGQSFFLDLDIIAGLQVHPETIRKTEKTSQTQTRISGDSTDSVNDFVDSPGELRYPEPADTASAPGVPETPSEGSFPGGLEEVFLLY